MLTAAVAGSSAAKVVCFRRGFLRAALGPCAGRSGDRDGGGNRFAPLAEQGGGGGGGGAQRGTAAADWRAVVRLDMQSEWPAWPATCYGHQRGQARAVVIAQHVPAHKAAPRDNLACMLLLRAMSPAPRMRAGGLQLPHLPACVLSTAAARQLPLRVAPTSLGARAQACDWGGDISFEEARWAQLQAVAAGRPPAALAAEMAAAGAAQNRLYQVPTALAARGSDAPGGNGFAVVLAVHMLIVMFPDTRSGGRRVAADVQLQAHWH